jgi:hypothetical protein
MYKDLSTRNFYSLVYKFLVGLHFAHTRKIPPKWKKQKKKKKERNLLGLDGVLPFSTNLSDCLINEQMIMNDKNAVIQSVKTIDQVQ